MTSKDQRRIKLARFALEHPEHKARIVEALRKQTGDAIPKTSAKNPSDTEFAKTVSRLLQQGEEALIDEPSKQRGRKKAAAKKVYKVEPWPGTLHYWDLPKQYKKIEKKYKDPKLLELLKELMEKDSEEILKREWDEKELLQKNLIEKIEDLNEEALRLRKKGMGFIKSRLWLRKKREKLREDTGKKIKKLRKESTEDLDRVFDEYCKKHPLLKKASMEILTRQGIPLLNYVLIAHLSLLVIIKTLVLFG